MAEKSGFFNSFYGDRVYNAAFFAEYFSSFIGNGVYAGGTALKVEPFGGNMDIAIQPGQAWINGYYYRLQDAPKVMTISPSHLTMGRIDRIVLRLDLNESNRRVSVEVKEGATSDTPVAPELERTAAIWELGLADVRVNAGVTEVLGSNVTDLRLDNAMCGIVTSVVEQADLTEIFNQFQAYYTERKDEFDGWLEGMRNVGESDYLKLLNQWIGQREEYSGWFDQIKAELYNNIYFQFENWVQRVGYRYLTQFGDGSITEQIINVNNSTVLASRLTEFDVPESGAITETLQVAEPAIHVRKVTRFDVPEPGMVSEEITEVEA